MVKKAEFGSQAIIKTVLEGIHNYEGVVNKRVQEESQKIDLVLEQIKKEAQLMEVLGKGFQVASDQGDSDIEQSLDEIIETLKEVAVSFETLERSNQSIKTSAQKISVAKDAKDILEHSMHIHQDLNKILQSIQEINRESHQEIKKAHSQETLSWFEGFFGKNSAK